MRGAKTEEGRKCKAHAMRKVHLTTAAKGNDKLPTFPPRNMETLKEKSPFPIPQPLFPGSYAHGHGDRTPFRTIHLKSFIVPDITPRVRIPILQLQISAYREIYLFGRQKDDKSWLGR